MTLSLDRTLGVGVVEWIEANLVHGPGDVQGEPLRLDDEQTRFILDAYAINDAGRRLVRRAVYSRAKGRAKSELAAALVCAEALGPVRFSHWSDPKARTGPVGRCVTAPFIKCVATEEGQAGNTYGAVEFMLREGRAGLTPGLDVALTRTFLPGGGEIRAVSSKAASKDGGKETFVNFDETHLYVGEGLVQTHATLRRNLGKRKQAEPWSLETTTMYAPGEGSVAETAHVYASKIMKGDVRDGGFLFDHVEGPPVDDFDDDAQSLASLRVAYGEASGWMDFDRLLADAGEARESVEAPRLVGEFRRYFLNQPTRRAEVVWVPAGVWRQGDRDTLPPPDGVVGVGVDMDMPGVWAAVARAWRVPGGVAVSCEVWTTRQGGTAHHVLSGDVVPDAVIDAAVDQVAAAQRGRVAVHAYRRVWSGDGVSVQVRDMTHRDLLDATQAFHRGCHAGTILHATDGVVEKAVAATRAKDGKNGWAIAKTPGSPWPVATVALARAVHALEAGGVVSVYETEELLAV